MEMPGPALKTLSTESLFINQFSVNSLHRTLLRMQPSLYSQQLLGHGNDMRHWHLVWAEKQLWCE